MYLRSVTIKFICKIMQKDYEIRNLRGYSLGISRNSAFS